jgi:Flp pilus assembly pilin Flp
MYIKNKRGQSTVEYVLLVTAVLAAIIAFVSTKGTGLQAQMNTTLNQATSDIGDMGNRLTSAHGESQLGSASPEINVNIAN